MVYTKIWDGNYVLTIGEELCMCIEDALKESCKLSIKQFNENDFLNRKCYAPGDSCNTVIG